jgi:tetratricopeptide (TPR) repeat protein
LGQAKCLQRQSQFAEAVAILGQVVRQSDSGDARLQAEAYLRLGDAYASLGDQTMPAIMAYLPVDVVPALAQHSDLHAEALYHLAQLWPAAGRQERGAEASARLVDFYPNSEWTKRLTGTE